MMMRDKGSECMRCFFIRTKWNRGMVTMVMMVIKMFEMMMVVVVVLRDKCISGLCFNWD